MKQNKECVYYCESNNEFVIDDIKKDTILIIKEINVDTKVITVSAASYIGEL